MNATGLLLIDEAGKAGVFFAAFLKQIENHFKKYLVE
jgi:hypothetical protein